MKFAFLEKKENDQIYHIGILKKETANTGEAQEISACVPVEREQKNPGLPAAAGPCGTLLCTPLSGPTIKPIQSSAKRLHEQLTTEKAVVWGPSSD